MTLVLIALGGGAGAGARFIVDGALTRRNPFPLPLGTLVINVAGSLLLGLLVGWQTLGSGRDTAHTLASVAGTGFCGGFTTFSTAHVESFRLWFTEGWSRGVGYAVLTLVGSVAGAALGLSLGSLL